MKQANLMTLKSASENMNENALFPDNTHSNYAAVDVYVVLPLEKCKL